MVDSYEASSESLANAGLLSSLTECMLCSQHQSCLSSMAEGKYVLLLSKENELQRPFLLIFFASIGHDPCYGPPQNFVVLSDD